MVKPEDVNLIIFDMDGTIVMSQPLVYEAVKRAFAKLGWPVNIQIEDINRFIGVSVASTAGSLYEFITPPDGGLTPDEVRELVRAEYGDIFNTMALSFPGVKETLAALRKRGYKLAQYTNASTSYLNTVMSSLGLREYYDYVECVEDNKLTKNQLAGKIKKHFGLEAAIVGDRCHDIEAARENDCLSIGALYGYGEKEPEAADLTIKQFPDLLTIFDRRQLIFEKIEKDIIKKKQKDKAFIIGVNGIDCSGKTTFANALESCLKAKGYPTQMIAMDDFLFPKAIRYSGTDPAEGYYRQSFNIERLSEKLLQPIHDHGACTARLDLLDRDTDRYTANKLYTVSPDTIIILEGVFLFRKELASYLNYKIYLDISFEELKRRGVLRDTAETFSKYDSRYIPGQKRYIEECHPASQADIVIDNTDAEYPKFKPVVSNRIVI